MDQPHLATSIFYPAGPQARPRQPVCRVQLVDSVLAAVHQRCIKRLLVCDHFYSDAAGRLAQSGSDATVLVSDVYLSVFHVQADAVPQTDGADQSGLFRDIRTAVHIIATDRCKGLSANLVIGGPNVIFF